MNNEKPMFKLAMSYLARGWSVLPCGKNKIPVIPWKFLQERYPTEQEVRSWFDKYPDAQVGIVTGKISNLTVVDFEKGADPSDFPQNTLIAKTGGSGYHYFYLFDEGMNNKARIKDLVDIRSEGGYVVAPGSCSEKGSYEILQDVPLLPFPKHLFAGDKVDIFSNASPRNTSNPKFDNKKVDEYPGYGKGQRNDEMTRYIGHVLTQIHPYDWDLEAWPIIQQANMKNTPPLGSTELLATFNSIKATDRRNNPTGRSYGHSIASSGVVTLTPEEPLILGEDSDEIKHIAEVAEAQKIDANDIYPLQMKCFDEVIDGGVNPGDVVVVAGQTGHGKTTLVQDWTISMIKGEKKAKALWFSYEVLPSHLWKKFQEMGMKREDCAFIPAKHSTGNVAWIETKIKEGKEKFGIKSVFIDHLGFLLPKTQGVLGKNISNNLASFITQIMRDLKTVALREEVIIFLPVHMKKVDSGQRQADTNDIKDSSGIGQEADLVFLIEREKDRSDGARSYFTDKTKITLAKNRKTGITVVGNFFMLNGRFAYDDTEDKINADFENFGKTEVKETLPLTSAPVVATEKVETEVVPVMPYPDDSIEAIALKNF